MALPSSIEPSLVARISRAQYDAMVSSGALDDARVELLEGVLVEMSPQGPAHAGVIEVLAQLLRERLARRARVREEKPFVAGDDAEPEPDIAVVPHGDPVAAHPDRAFLVVEVADTSARKDRGVKAGIYARAGVPEYWVVHVVERTVEVSLDSREGRYARTSIVRAPDAITLASFPDVQIEVGLFLR